MVFCSYGWASCSGEVDYLLLLLNAPHASTNIPDGRRLGVGGPIVSWSGANAGYWREANNWNGGAPEQASRVIVDAA